MTLKLCLLAAILLPLLGCSLVPLLGRRLGRRVSRVALAFPVIAFLSLLIAMSQLEPGTRTVVSWNWIPSLNLPCSFLLDGLSLFFGLVVSGMGVLIFFYAGRYLDDHYRHQGRFYAYLTLFMAAMLGTVLANNLLLLFVFWELTGLASFLLIGFLHEEAPSRVGARQALLVTGLTGLVMLVGVILVGQVAGTLELDRLLEGGLPWAAAPGLLGTAMVCLMIGAFGKSAQIPFQFWLPNAMAAPTPVSAYLHSATMVKLGVFLAARVFPLFAGQEGWATLLMTAGFATMLLGAALALLSNDLKAILAWSTVSALGSFIGYYGMGQAGGVAYDYLHIANHVFYKGCLFMVAGIVTHATGLRDIRQLGGLFRRMPLLGVITALAAASMAGLPGTIGFISKEAMLQEVFKAPATHGALGVFAATTVVLASIFKVAFSIRFFAQIFLGPEPAAVSGHYHDPGATIQWPPLVLSGAALVFGLAPASFESLSHRFAAPGLNPHPAHLAFWHGFTAELATSLAITLMGLLIYWLGRNTAWRWTRVPVWLQEDRAFEAGLRGLNRFSRCATRWMRFDSPVDYLPILMGFLALAVGGYLTAHWLAGEASLSWTGEVVWGPEANLRAFVAILMAIAVVGVIFLKSWTSQLISLSVSGFLMTFYYVLYQAPDLALTQILVDTAALILILILLGRFPRKAELADPVTLWSKARKAVNLLISLGVGATLTLLVLVMTAHPNPDRIGQRFLDTTVELAGGTNAVNTVLVDYRGFDTLGEITVLFIAMLACLGLVMRRQRSELAFREGPLAPPDPNSEVEDSR